MGVFAKHLYAHLVHARVHAWCMFYFCTHLQSFLNSSVFWGTRKCCISTAFSLHFHFQTMKIACNIFPIVDVIQVAKNWPVQKYVSKCSKKLKGEFISYTIRIPGWEIQKQDHRCSWRFTSSTTIAPAEPNIMQQIVMRIRNMDEIKTNKTTANKII